MAIHIHASVVGLENAAWIDGKISIQTSLNASGQRLVRREWKVARCSSVLLTFPGQVLQVGVQCHHIKNLFSLSNSSSCINRCRQPFQTMVLIGRKTPNTLSIIVFSSVDRAPFRHPSRFKGIFVKTT